MRGRRIVVRGVIVGSLLSFGVLVSFRGIGAPRLTQEAERLQKELEAEIPQGSDAAVIKMTFERRKWNATFDSRLGGYFYLIKENTGRDGILVQISVDQQGRSTKIEVKAIYSPDLG